MADGAKTLLLLPGSRKGEVGKLMEPFRKAVDILESRGNRLKLLLPTVPNVHKLVEHATADWQTKPEIIPDAAGKWQAIGEADAALCASGTVTLELALANVPLVSCYKLDWLIRQFASFIPTWSASLPNLIADRAVVPEYYDAYVRPGHIARSAEALFADTPLRRWQLEGFAEIRRRLHTETPAGEIATEVVLDEVRKRSAEV
jgi:lipid-A-disaccharide synthase